MASKRLAAVAALVFAACASDKPAVKTASAAKPPAWLTKVTSNSDMLYFVGSKEGAGSLDEGRAAALDAARAQAAQYVGVKIAASHVDVESTTVADNMARDQVQSQAQALVRSAELADTYSEKISREVGSGVVERYDVWVLVRLPRAEVDKERARQAEEKRQVALASLTRFREGQALEKAGELLQALRRYHDVIQVTKELGTDVPTGDDDIKNAAALRQRAGYAAQGLQAKVRRTIVVAPDWVAGALTKALSAKGFTSRVNLLDDEQSALKAARQDGTPWVIVVRASATPGGNVFSQVAASASLDVRALDAKSGAVVASSLKRAKGVGKTPDAAKEAAANEAGEGAGAELAAALVAKEDVVP